MLRWNTLSLEALGEPGRVTAFGPRLITQCGTISGQTSPIWGDRSYGRENWNKCLPPEPMVCYDKNYNKK